jgi:Cu(I)/Ag(I) efflux system membrane protein CusA/SilA
MIDAIIRFSVNQRALVLLLALAAAVAGGFAMVSTPVDAIPDLSERQVIVFTDWPGRSPREVEDQVTYPLSVNLQALAGVKAVRSTSELEYSMVVVVFEDGVDLYFARQRVLERLSTAASFLPPGVIPTMGPDATALGQVWWYTLEGGGLDPGELRALQDSWVRYALQAVPGVAQVASVGGFVQEWQVDVDPVRLRALGVTLGEVFEAIARSNASVGGNVVTKGGAEYLVRGAGWLRGRDDLEQVVVASRDGVPLFVKNVASVQLGPAPRRAALEKDGAEAVGGVVVMRDGENPRDLTQRLEARVATLAPGLPAGVRLVPFYDRTPLIDAALGTLVRTLLEEVVVASLLVLLVLRHARSAFVICVTLPLAVLLAFLAMRLAGVTSNIMSLSGIAISIGVLLDAGIVITENAYARLRERFGTEPVTGDTRPIVLEACLAVGRPLFFSVAIMLLSFLPVFALGGLEGRMFWPLALTKTFALVGVAILAITVVPALLPTFVRGKLQSETENPIVRSVADVYRPTVSWLMDRPRAVLVAFAVLLGLGGLLSQRLGSEFMPPLDERSILDMPITSPSASVAEVRDSLVVRDGLLRSLPEVQRAVGKAGRADTPTDPSPVDMVETIVTLRPDAEWPRRHLDYETILAAARAGLGVTDGASAEREDVAAQVAMQGAEGFDAWTREVGRSALEKCEVAAGEAAEAGIKDALWERPDVDGWFDRPRAPLRITINEDMNGVGSAFSGDLELAWSQSTPPSPSGPELFRTAILPWEVEAVARGFGASPEDTPRLVEVARRLRSESLAQTVRDLDATLAAHAPARLAALLAEAARSRAEGVQLDFARHVPDDLGLRRKTKADLIAELDALCDVPGWANIWTQPIINRVDMLATGVRTQLGVKVFGDDLDTIQQVARDVADALRGVQGAVDVVPDQVTGERYLEVTVDRARAARWGVDVQAVQDTVEVALGGRRITTTIEGRRRYAVRVRYPRDLRADEEAVRRILVAGSGVGAEGTTIQVPLGAVADVAVKTGPSMIKSEDGRLRAYVQLNVRGRDIVGFVEEARRVVGEKVKLPQGIELGWSGQFEHQVRAKRTLSWVLPVVVLIIFAILYLTYGDLADAGLMLLSVPGALVGGVILQWALGVPFSVAVWVGYIACFGLATETGIIMLIYLREALERAGGLAAIPTVEALRQTVIDGAVHRLRPKLLTEGTILLGLVPMLLATGVGAEVMRPMAAPVLGGILLADEVIDVFLPVLFFQVRKRRWEALREAAARPGEVA